mmetsp:Transcript_82/g.262  ORF Transcript_82/g.262 Transcript_82/m.262 type:complete len:271 (+) Transcript_82:977-1789(+)
MSERALANSPWDLLPNSPLLYEPKRASSLAAAVPLLRSAARATRRSFRRLSSLLASTKSCSASVCQCPLKQAWRKFVREKSRSRAAAPSATRARLSDSALRTAIASMLLACACACTASSASRWQVLMAPSAAVKAASCCAAQTTAATRPRKVRRRRATAGAQCWHSTALRAAASCTERRRSLLRVIARQASPAPRARKADEASVRTSAQPSATASNVAAALRTACASAMPGRGKRYESTAQLEPKSVRARYSRHSCSAGSPLVENRGITK